MHGQRGRIEDQRCSLDPSKSVPNTPKHTDLELADSTVKTGRRLNDQRVFLPSLPGIQNGGTTSTTAADIDASYLCYMVSKVQVGPHIA
uniref:Uncharacterized protein n=1 Tax=Anabas testudineus TaxID=64144 RepID=A0A7N5ZTK2_ANATE